MEHYIGPEDVNNRSNSSFWVAIDTQDGGNVVGCIAVKFCSFRKGFEINRLCVRAEYRNRNIGGRLLDACESFVRRQMEISMEKNLVFAVTPCFMDSAHALYTKKGFQKDVAFTMPKDKVVNLTVFSKEVESVKSNLSSLG